MEKTIVIPAEFVTGEPDEPHNPVVQGIIDVMAKQGYTFLDYGCGEMNIEIIESDDLFSELCFVK